MSTDPTIVVVVALYMGALLYLGWLACRRTRTCEDFYLAGRSLGSWITAISSTASSESGWVVLGAVGMVYAGGVSALWFAPGCLLGYLINLYWLAPRLRREAARQGSLTLPDFLADRFGDPRHVIRIAAVTVILLSLGGYLAAQMTATGKAMDSILNVGYVPGILIGGAIIIVYTLLGGFTAVSFTDFFQGLIMVISLVVMPVLVLVEAGGYEGLLSRLAAIDPDLVSITGGKEGFALFGFIAGLVGIGLGYPGQPHVITRYMAAASDEKIRQTQLIAICWGVLVFYGAGFLGLGGRLIMPELAAGGDPEKLFPLLSRSMLHPLLAGVMLAAILSAIMSTVSSQLLVCASAVSRDIIGKILGKTQDDRLAVRAGRITVAVLGLAAIGVAIGEVRVVFWFVLFAWSGLGAAFGPVLLLSLSTKLLSRAGVVAGMLTGFGVTVIWKFTGLSDSIIYELVPAFFGAALVSVAVSLIGRRTSPPAAPAGTASS